jgi:hypothetical protein
MIFSQALQKEDATPAEIPVPPDKPLDFNTDTDTDSSPPLITAAAVLFNKRFKPAERSFPFDQERKKKHLADRNLKKLHQTIKINSVLFF